LFEFHQFKLFLKLVIIQKNYVINKRPHEISGVYHAET